MPVVIVNRSKTKYLCSLYNGIGIGICQMLIGAVLTVILMYSLKTDFKDMHIILCTFGSTVQSHVLGKNHFETLFCGVGTGILQLIFGATLTAIMMFCITAPCKDGHVMLCTFGFHFFCVEGILSLNFANGWSSPMRLRHRRCVHIIMQLIGMAMVSGGTFLITENQGIQRKTHATCGYIATVLALFNILVGPGALFGGQYWKALHVTFGLPAFIMSSVCFCTGIQAPSFEVWAGHTVTNILLCFIIFYTTFIAMASFMKCASRIQYLM